MTTLIIQQMEKSYYTVGHYRISTECLQTYPCKHYVKDVNSNVDELRMMCSDKIYKMLKNENLSHAHFNEYEEFVRKHENPTVEELAEKQIEEDRVQEEMQKREKEQEEKNAIIDKYKASTHLERLKLKHSKK